MNIPVGLLQNLGSLEASTVTFQWSALLLPNRAAGNLMVPY